MHKNDGGRPMRKKTFALIRNKQVFFAVYQIIITFAREGERD